MEHEIIITLEALPGEDLETMAEYLLDAFEAGCPGYGPVVSAHRNTNTFDVLFSLDAGAADDAFQIALPLVLKALANSEISPRPVAGIEINVRHLDRELVPA